MKNSHGKSFVIAFAIILFSKILSAQDPSGATVNRSGFVIGISAGPTYVHLRSNDAQVASQFSISAPNMKIGAMINSRTALLVSLPGSVYSYTLSGRKRDRGFEGIVPTLQYWMTERLWINGGIGLGMDAPAFYDIKDESERKFYFGGAFITGIGYEFWQKSKFTMDLQARIHLGNSKQPEGMVSGASGEILIGINWY